MATLLHQSPLMAKLNEKLDLGGLLMENNGLRLFQQLVKSLNNSILMVLADTDGKLVYVNDHFSAISGYTNTELAGRPLDDLRSNLYTERQIQQFWEWLARGKTWHGELCNQRRDGSLYWIEAQVFPLQDRLGVTQLYMLLAFDLTRRNYNELALAEVESRLRQLVESSLDSLIILQHDGQVAFVSPPIRELLGYAPDAVVGYPISTFLDLSYSPSAREFIELFRWDLIPAPLYMLKFRHATGDPRYLEVRVRKLEQFDKGQYLLNLHDITERVRAEEYQSALEQERKRLERSKLYAVVEAQENERQRLAEDLHDGIGQLLSAARLNLEAMLELPGKGDEQSQKLVAQAHNLITQAIDDTRAVSHNLMPNSLRDFGLRAALENLVEQLTEAGKLQVDLHLSPKLPTLPEKMQVNIYRIVQELTNNVVRHSHATEAMIQLVLHDLSLVLMVEDNGVGFETNNQENRQGIGLKNIQSRVSFLQGSLLIDSSPKRGCSVTVEIPLRENGRS